MEAENKATKPNTCFAFLRMMRPSAGEVGEIVRQPADEFLIATQWLRSLQQEMEKTAYDLFCSHPRPAREGHLRVRVLPLLRSSNEGEHTQHLQRLVWETSSQELPTYILELRRRANERDSPGRERYCVERCYYREYKSPLPH